MLVIGTALQSKYLNWKIPENSIFYGDGSGAAYIKSTKSYGLMATDIFTDSKAYEEVRLQGGGNLLTSENFSQKKKEKYLYDMNGLETWKQVIVNQPKVIANVINKAKMKKKNIDLFIFHQANRNLLQYLSTKLGIDKSKTFSTVSKYGNTADASIAITLNDAITKSKIKKGSVVLISGVGAGFVFGASIFKWY